MENVREESNLKRIYSKLASGSADDLIFRNHSLLELATLYMEKCDFRNAVDCLEKVKTEALQFHLYDNYFAAVNMLLRIYAERLESNLLASLLREVAQVAISVKDYEKYKSKLFYNQAIFNSYQSDYAAAISLFKQAEEAAQARTDYHDLFNAQYGIAICYLNQGHVELALEKLDALLQQVFEVTHGEKASEQVQLKSLEASIYIAEGNCYRMKKQFQKALDKFWTAHGILKSQKNWCHYYYVLLGLGRTYLEMEDAGRATIFFDLIEDAIAGLELNELRETLNKVSRVARSGGIKLAVDRDRKIVIEKSKGEVSFERRFVLLEILNLFASEPGRVFTKDEIVKAIWNEAYNPITHDSKVYTSISRLRKLIEPDYKHPRYILNERDGYSFNPKIQIEELSSLRKQ